MDKSIYQIICDEIINLDIPEWNRLIFVAMYTDTSFEMKFYVKHNEKYSDCFSIGIPIHDIINLFSKLDKSIMIHRNKMYESNTSKWSVMTLSIEDSGSFNVDYDYDDTSSDSIAYMEMWKKKYLI